MIPGHRFLIIGEAPAPNGDLMFDGASGTRLCKLTGLRIEELHETFALINLLPEYPGPKFPLKRGQEAADTLFRYRTWRGWEAVLLAGRSVAASCGVMFGTPFFLWFYSRETACAVIPHPSGLNRWWNDKSHWEEAEQFFRGLVAIEKP